jgi:hypothetical protein
MRVPKTALFIDRDSDPVDKVNVISATVVNFFRAFMCASSRMEGGFKHLKHSVAYKNLNTAFASFLPLNR